MVFFIHICNLNRMDKALFKIGLMAFLFFISCKNRKQFAIETGDDAQTLHVLQHEWVLLLQDVQKAVSETFELRGKFSSDTLVDYSIDTTELKNNLLKLKYQSVLIAGHRRSGTLYIFTQGGLKWKERHAQLKVELINMSLYNEISGLQIQLNGSLELTNLSGGTWFEVAYLNLQEFRYLAKSIQINWTLGNQTPKSLNAYMQLKVQKHQTLLQGLATQDTLRNIQFWGYLPDGRFFYQYTLLTPELQFNCSRPVWKNGSNGLLRPDFDFILNTCYESEDCPQIYKIKWSRKRQQNQTTKAL